jgi:hypothetical protein
MLMYVFKMAKNASKLLQTVKIHPFKVDMIFVKSGLHHQRQKAKNQIPCLTLNAWFFTVTCSILMIRDAF